MLKLFQSRQTRKIKELELKIQDLEQKVDDMTEYCMQLINHKRPLSKLVGQRVLVRGTIVHQEQIFRHNQNQLKIVLKPAYINDIPVNHLNVFIVYDKLDKKMTFQTVEFEATVERYRKVGARGKTDFDFGILPPKKGFYVAKSNELGQKYKIPQAKKKMNG